MDEHEPKSHLVGRVREALAEDPRTNTLDIQVTVAGGKVFLFGQVASLEMRHAAGRVVREVVPESVPVVNDLEVAALVESTGREWLP